MPEGLVTFLLVKFAKFLEEEGKLLRGVPAEAEQIKDELEFMVTFLRVAEAMEEEDLQLKMFAKKVRDIVYDMEDALDDFKLSLTHDHGRMFYSTLRKVAHLFMRLKVQHQIGVQMRSMKERVTDISKMHRKYLMSNNMMERGSSSSGTRQPSRRWYSFLIEEADPTGIDGPKRQLIEWLFDSKSEREVISVVGMGGLGKTTLVKKVYDDTEVQKHFEFCAWITLSQSLVMEEFLKDIIQQLSYALRISDPQGLDLDLMNITNLRMVINEFLRERKYLIVLDNLLDAEAWSDFGSALPDNSCGSRILLTTRNQVVASALSRDKVFPLDRLSEEDSSTLFCKKIFRNNTCPRHLENVMKDILVRCHGLPLAIVAASGILAAEDSGRLDRWEMVRQSLPTTLADDANLKKGFVKAKEGMTLEEIAETYLSELIKRSLVQVVETTTDGRVKSCRMHEILLDIIIPKSIDQGFVEIAKEQNINWPRKVRRLSIQSVMPNIEQGQGQGLRSLLVFGKIESSPESFSLKLPTRRIRLLNVLDLGGTPLKKFPKEIVNFILLKYLSMRNTKVSSIPSSIGRLQNLETFDLKHTQVTELPSEILKLQKLRHLLVYRYEMKYDDQIHTKYGCKLPAQIGGLLSVEKLCFLEATQGNDLFKELGKLKQLRRLGIVNLRKEDGEALCSSIEMLRNLNALSVTSFERSQIIDMENLSSTPRFLARLYLTGRLEKLPDWISTLDSLVKLVLKWSRLNDDPLPYLQQLASLVHLEFVDVYNGDKLCFQAPGFQKLKFLGLNKLEKVDTITIEQGAMPDLEKLIVQSCKSLQRLPLGIEHLSKLKEVEFFNMPLKFIMTLHPNGEEQDYLKVERVPDVYFTYWNNGKWDMYSLSEIFKEGSNSATSGASKIERPRHIWK
ncbi:disease resistance protein RPM1-like [Euphorbia lathyris]|uniref:disease resistance protein RPM1-like n=1 Tax=Euphorbia lathyris TaxID=212925 RepID=UPI003313E5F3